MFLPKTLDDNKAIVWPLYAMLVVLFVFILSFGTFLVLKERWCARGLNTPACFTTYGQFMRSLPSRI